MSSQLVEPHLESPSDDSRLIPVKMPRDSGKTKGHKNLPTLIAQLETILTSMKSCLIYQVSSISKHRTVYISTIISLHQLNTHPFLSLKNPRYTKLPRFIFRKLAFLWQLYVLHHLRAGLFCWNWQDWWNIHRAAVLQGWQL